MDYLVYRIADLQAGAEALRHLPDVERDEARRRGGRYALFRSLLRQELSRRTGIPPRLVSISYNAHGKPECEQQPFNMSHSGDCLCLAFHHRSIGVDVEHIRMRNFASLAARFMGAEQLAAFQSRNCPQEEFYTCWCATEALVKHAGDTMWNARQYPFRYIHGTIECLFDNAPAIHLFTPMPGYCGAVAYTP